MGGDGGDGEDQHKFTLLKSTMVCARPAAPRPGTNASASAANLRNQRDAMEVDSTGLIVSSLQLGSRTGPAA